MSNAEYFSTKMHSAEYSITNNYIRNLALEGQDIPQKRHYYIITLQNISRKKMFIAEYSSTEMEKTKFICRNIQRIIFHSRNTKNITLQKMSNGMQLL